MRLIDAEALSKHKVESDKINDTLLVVPISYILDAPTFDLKDKILESISDVAKELDKARQTEDRDKFFYLSGVYSALAAVAKVGFDIKLEDHFAYK